MGTTAVAAAESIDTDRIIPARFLTTTSRTGLGEKLFADWPGRPERKGATILVAGRNFGCGSSREHAVWALRDAGYRAVISSELADIFQRNAVKNGLVPVVLDVASHARLLAAPGAEVTVDVERLVVALPSGGEAPFVLAPFDRHCLVEGEDELEFLLSQETAITAYESRSGG
jgi:3-isopropylmalate/(R)-2-methylmalate dehydratase small subunit